MFDKAREAKNHKRESKRIFVAFLDFGGFREDFGGYRFCYLG